jgi:hypothetical protein
MVIVKITFARPDTDAAFHLAGIPNGTCTSSFGSRLIQSRELHYIFRLDDSRPSVRRSIENDFQDIRAVGKPGDILDVQLLSFLEDVME